MVIAVMKGEVDMSDIRLHMYRGESQLLPGLCPYHEGVVIDHG